MLWVEIKYIQLTAARLRNFKRKGTHLWNFSCPFCGDSKHRSRAARGYIYRKGDHLNYDCKKCGVGMSARNFIKTLDPSLYSEMNLEMFAPEKPKDELPVIKGTKLTFNKNALLTGLIKVSSLPDTHLCKSYILKRSIPEMYWDELYYVDGFFGWANKIVPEKYKREEGRKDEPRLVIIIRNRDGDIIGFQGRQLLHDPNGVKYISISLKDDKPLIWGVERIQPKYMVYVFEGPLDAMFVPNAIACCGGDLVSGLVSVEVPKENLVIVYDNEPRSKHTIGKMMKAISMGFSVCIWPDIPEKDVNEMVQKRIKYGLVEACKFVFNKINQGIRRGPSAKIALDQWKKAKIEKQRKPLIMKAMHPK